MKKKRDPAQISMTEEIIVDCFAGGGGASTGIEIATGRVVDIAINHDRDAILMHSINHPFTEHLQSDIFEVDPVDVCKGRPVGLLWASPDCRYFSKAKGAPLVNRHIRGLSWVIIKWCLMVRPRVVLQENVEEIVGWGPLIPVLDKDTGRPLKTVSIKGNGRARTKMVPADPGEFIPYDQEVMAPDPERKGETFKGFVSILTAGISPEHPAFLECCEFLGISPESLEAQKLIRGLGYTVEHREIVAADLGAPTSRKRFVLCARCDGRPIKWPERTHAPADSPDVKSGKCKPWRAAAEIIDWSLPMYSIFDTKEQIKQKYGVNAVRPLADNTLRRIICGTDKYTIKNDKPFFLIPTGYGEREGQAPRTHDPDKPLSTVVSTVKQNLAAPVVAPFIHQGKFQNAPQSAEKPLTTVTSVGAHELASVNLISYHDEQLTAKQKERLERGVAKETDGLTGNARVNGLDGLLPTVDASNRFGLATAHLTEYYGNGNALDLSAPMRTVTSHDREGLLACHLDKYFGGGYSGVGKDLDDPLTTVTHEPRHSMVAAHVAEFKGDDKGQSVWLPLRTITASAGEFGAVKTVIERYDCNRDLGYWPEIRKLLNKYCGYSLAENEVLLLIVGEIPFYIRDILLRMLAPRELYSAMGFPPDYVIDFVDPQTGKDYPKSAKVARCGNAVCPPMAEAMVRANLPEWCGEKIETMAQFRRIVSA